MGRAAAGGALFVHQTTLLPRHASNRARVYSPFVYHCVPTCPQKSRDAEVKQANLDIQEARKKLGDLKAKEYSEEYIKGIKDGFPAQYTKLGQLRGLATELEGQIQSLEAESKGLIEDPALPELRRNLETTKADITVEENDLKANKEIYNTWIAEGPEYEYNPDNPRVSQVCHTDRRVSFFLSHLFLCLALTGGRRTCEQTIHHKPKRLLEQEIGRRPGEKEREHTREDWVV